MPETTAFLQFVLLILLIGFIFTVELYNKRWKIISLAVFTVLTFWLWFPWLVYGVQVVWRKNTAMIAHMERTPIVEPADTPIIKAEK